MKFLLRHGLKIGIGGIFAIAVLIFTAHQTVETAAKGRLHDRIEDVPRRKAALVLGCAKQLTNGNRNTFFSYRISAAAELYRNGKCQFLIVSGDNSRKSYDEPTDMRDALIALGVPPDRIYRDYAGFSTLESIVRAKEIFGQDDFIVISQSFHAKRGLFIAGKRDCPNSIGFIARQVTSRRALKTRLREYLARVKTVLDIFVLKTEPRFLGEKVVLGGPVT